MDGLGSPLQFNLGWTAKPFLVGTGHLYPLWASQSKVGLGSPYAVQPKLDCKAPTQGIHVAFVFPCAVGTGKNGLLLPPVRLPSPRTGNPCGGVPPGVGGVPRRPFFSSYGEEKWPPYAVQPKLDCKAHTT